MTPYMANGTFSDQLRALKGPCGDVIFFFAHDIGHRNTADPSIFRGSGTWMYGA